MDKKEKSTLARVLGAIFVTVVFTCLAAVLVALTAKFIFWLY